MNILKGKILFKLHNCLFCHFENFKKNNYPKIRFQYSTYLILCLKQYQINFNNNILSRNNFLMKSQIQNLSIYDIKNIISYLSFF